MIFKVENNTTNVGSSTNSRNLRFLNVKWILIFINGNAFLKLSALGPKTIMYLIYKSN